MRQTGTVEGAQPRGATGAARTWQDHVLCAQLDLAERVAVAIGRRALDRQRYQHWLAIESALCRLDALALEAIATWHAAAPELHATALAWAAAQRADAQAAAAEVRGLDGMAPALPAQLGEWQAFVTDAAATSRAGEALGTVVLHARLMRGPMRQTAQATTALSFVGPGTASAYLLRRSQPDDGDTAAARAALLDAYAASALAAGVARAARWYGAITTALLSTPPDAG